MAKKQKLPQLTYDTKILSFDLETNGLHGQAFAVGAVIINAQGEILEKFSGRMKINGPVDPWVTENVLPVINNIPINCKSYDELKECFWQWYLKTEEKSDYVVVNNGYPVEYRFLLDCQEADIEERYWQHPFPILDLTSLLIQIGATTANEGEFIKEFYDKHPPMPHNPVWDATIAALATFKAFRQSGQIS